MSGEIQIRPLHGIAELTAAEELQRQVWTGNETEVVPVHILYTIAGNGGVLLGAFDGKLLVGMVLGILGTDEHSPDRPALARLKHASHMMGVLPQHRDRNIGLLLKLAQRKQVLEQGVRLMSWTYDPLISRNAHLNIRRLGAICRIYKREIYGEMRDGINKGLPSDRFELDWWITSRRVATRLDGSRKALDLAHYLGAGAQKVNPASLDAAGLPRPSEEPIHFDGNLALVEIPPDFSTLKQRDPALAVAWRLHSRAIFEAAFGMGYIVTDFIHFKSERIPRSIYVLSHGEGKLG